MKKRLGLYATYNKDGILDEYIIYCLREYRKLVDELVVVSNQTLSSDSRKKLGFVDWIFERFDTGYDVGAFADTLTRLYGWERVYQFDEILFMNDSIFGPLYPVEPVMQEMELRDDVDFWGLTKRGRSDFDGGEEIYPAHIQLYFYVVNSRMLHSREFAEYWENIMHRVTDFRSAIINYEFEFTKYFEERGFKWDVAVKLPGYDTDYPQRNLSPYHYNCYELIKSGKYPFIKRKLFTGEFVYSKFSDKSDLRRAFDYIREQTDYDENLIWDYILKNYELGSIIKSLCLHEIIISESRANVGNICRDKYVLLVSEERKEDDPESLIDAKQRTITSNMVCSEYYVEKVLDLFEKNSRLGVLIPPMNMYGGITASIEKRWCDKKKAESICRKLDLQVPFSMDEAPVHEIHAAWCRKELLQTMESAGVLNKIDGTVLQALTLVAQNEGYYTEIVESTEYLKYQLTSAQTIMRVLLNFLEFDKLNNMTLETCGTEIMKRKVKAVLQQEEEVYVYGAGEKAFRLISAIKEFAEIKGIVVSDIKGNPTSVLGYNVKCLEEVHIEIKNSLILVTVGAKNKKSVELKLKELGLINYIFV